MAQEKKIIGWGIIIISLIFFWPLGLFLLYRRYATDRSAAMHGSVLLSVVAWFMIVLGSLGLLGTLTSSPLDGSGLVFGVFFVAGGIWLLKKSKAMRKQGQRYRQYISMIINQNLTSVDDIAAAVGTTYEAVKLDLETMISKNYFPGAYINEGKREIVVSLPQEEGFSGARSAVGVQKEVKICGSCGANNTIVVGQVGECEYCGSPI